MFLGGFSFLLVEEREKKKKKQEKRTKRQNENLNEIDQINFLFLFTYEKNMSNSDIFSCWKISAISCYMSSSFKITFSEKFLSLELWNFSFITESFNPVDFVRTYFFLLSSAHAPHPKYEKQKERKLQL